MNAKVKCVFGIPTSGTARFLRVTGFAMMFLILGLRPFAQPGAIDATFNAADQGFNFGRGPSGPIQALRVQPDGKILIVGSFENFNETTVNRIARLNADGLLDGTFTQGTGANNQVYSIAVQPDGKIVIGGEFDTYNGTTVNRIARLNADGTLDNSFNMGSGLAGGYPIVYSIAVQSDGKIVIGGAFTSYNGTPVNRIARLNADGTLDATFNPSGTGANSEIRSVAVQSDGKILIGGLFTGYNGSNVGRITRLNADGTLDATFNPSGAGATSNDIRSIALLSDGKILIVGNFTNYNGTSINRIARLNSDGTLDGTFTPGTGANSPIVSVAVQSDGKILIGGDFWEFNGASINRIARLNADGTLDGTFTHGPGAGSTVRSFAVLSDGKILIGGEFSAYDVNPSVFNIARLNANGTLDATFNPATGASDRVRSIAVQSDGKILIGGDFTRYNGTFINRIARLNAVGTLDATFNSGGSGAASSVHCIAVQSDGKILIGGRFQSYNGTSINRIVRLNADGTMDATFTPGSGAANNVNSIAVLPDGKILIGGEFTSYNGTSNINRIARLNSDGTLDGTFNPGGAGAPSTVNSIAVQSDGKILIVGQFTSYNGTSSINRIAKLNADGTLDGTFTPGTGANNTINSIAVQSDGKILIVGQFTRYNGTSSINRIARLNADGILDGTFNPGGAGAPSTVNSIAVQSDGKILIGGEFTSYNGTSSINRIARLNADGTLDGTFTLGTGVSRNVHSITIQSDGRILIGGDFTSYNGTGRNRVARLLAFCTNPASGGTIAAAQSGNSPFDPVAFTSTAAASGESGTLEYKWQSSATSSSAGFSDIASSNSDVYDAGSLTQTTWFKRLARVSCQSDWTGAAESNVLEVTVTATTKNWVGGDGNWNVGANWSGGTVPVSSDVITVTSGHPKLNVDVTVAGSLTLSGTGSLTVEPGRTLTVSGTADFGGKSVTFRSDATGTAQLGNLTGTLTGATNATVERFIPATGRRWRLLTAPLTGITINNAWQKGQTWNGTSTLNSDGTGTVITGQQQKSASNANARGFDFWSAVSNSSASIMSYVPNTTVGSWGVMANTNTANAFNNGQAYLLFVRGPRGSGFTTGTANAATTLRPTGTLRQGEINVTVDGTKGHTMVGNPYASQIDFNAMYLNSGNSSVIKRQFWAWDATSGASGAWTAVVYSVDKYVEVPRKFHTVGNASPLTAIQSGHGFTVQPVGASGGTMKIRESNKIAAAAASPNILLGGQKTARLFVNLTRPEASGEQTLLDGVMVAYRNGYRPAATDADDAVKMENLGENLAVSVADASLTADARPESELGRPVALRLWNLNEGVYRFEVKAEEMVSGGLKAWLEDRVRGTRTPLPVNGEVGTVEFSVGADAASRSEDRFRIVFEQPSVNASIVQEPGGANGKALSVYPNPVTGRTLTVRLQQVPKGTYSLQLLGGDGRLVTDRRIEHDGGSGTYRMELNGALPKGSYQLRCVSGERSIGSEKLVFQ